MSVNRFIGIGNLTRDAEVRTVGQQQVAKFGLAMSEKFKKQDGTLGESTEFIDVELWGQPGVFPYLVKGQQVYVEGSIRTESWTGQDGQRRSATKIRAISVQLLGSRPQTGTQQAAPAAPQYPPQYAPQPAVPAYQQPPVPPQVIAAPQAPPAPAAPQQPYQQYAPQVFHQPTLDDLPPDQPPF